MSKIPILIMGWICIAMVYYYANYTWRRSDYLYLAICLLVWGMIVYVAP